MLICLNLQRNNKNESVHVSETPSKPSGQTSQSHHAFGDDHHGPASMRGSQKQATEP